MATRNRLETLAVILAEMPYRESSKILVAYTEKIGKVSIMAKGARRAKSSTISLSQTFTHGRYFLSEGKNFYYLNRGILIDSNLKLRNSYEKMIYCSIIVELINRSTIEGKANKKVYGLLAKTLSSISESREPGNYLLAFLLKYISYMGYRPQLPKVYTPPMSFVPLSGGVVAESIQEVGGISLTQEDLELLNKLLYTSLDELFKIETKTNFNKILKILIHYIQVTLEIEQLNSLQFLV